MAILDGEGGLNRTDESRVIAVKSARTHGADIISSRTNESAVRFAEEHIIYRRGQEGWECTRHQFHGPRV